MNELNDMKYNYYNSNTQENTINSLRIKEFDYNLVNDNHISNTRNVSKPNIRLRNNYATR